MRYPLLLISITVFGNCGGQTGSLTEELSGALTTIHDVDTGRIAVGKRVNLRSVVVTGTPFRFADLSFNGSSCDAWLPVQDPSAPAPNGLNLRVSGQCSNNGSGCTCASPSKLFPMTHIGDILEVSGTAQTIELDTLCEDISGSIQSHELATTTAAIRKTGSRSDVIDR